MTEPRRSTPVLAFVSFGLAALLAGGALVIGPRALTEKAALVRRGWPLVRVMVAAHDLQAGAVLRREDLRAQDFPEQLVTDSLFRDARDLEGRTLYFPMTRGTPFHAASLGRDAAACAGERQ